MDADEQTMLHTWQARDALFRSLFGSHLFHLPKKYAPPVVQMKDVRSASDIAAILGTTVSERDVTIMVYEPEASRPYWSYITSGLSNPWFGGGDGTVAGFGHELMLKTNKPGRWQFRLLRRLSSYVLTYSGTLQPGVILQFDIPLFYSQTSKMDSVLIWYVDEAPDCVYDLPAGRFGIFLVLGITADESEFARSFSDGCWCMQQLLRNAGYGQVTDPFRDSIMSRDDIRSMVFSLRSYAQLFAPTENGE